MSEEVRDGLLRDIREVRGDLDAIVEAMQSAERPGAEEAGIAFVCAEHAIEIVNRLELDLIVEGLAA